VREFSCCLQVRCGPLSLRSSFRPRAVTGIKENVNVVVIRKKGLFIPYTASLVLTLIKEKANFRTDHLPLEDRNPVLRVIH
jgi:hypothetical protein